MVESIWPLHPEQRDVYWDQLINAGSPRYNVGGYIKLKGKLDKEKLRETVRSIPNVFDVFRMRFDLAAKDPVFYLEENYDMPELIELDFGVHDHPEQRALEWMQQRFNIPFTLEKDIRPFELFLIKINDAEHFFFNRYHHLITDGYGFAIWAKYIGDKYNSLVSGYELVQEHFPFAAEAAAASEYCKSNAYELQGLYWKGKLGEKPPAKCLRMSCPALDAADIKSGRYVFVLDRDQEDKLSSLKKATSASIQQLTLAALVIYFGKTSGQSDFVFGIPLHKRNSRRQRAVMGVFAGILPFFVSYNPEIKLIDLINSIAASLKRDYRNQRYRLGDMNNYVKGRAGEAFLEIIVNYELLDFQLNFGEHIQASTYELISEFSQFPLEFRWRDYGRQQPLEFCVEFKRSHFECEEAALLARRIFFIIEQFSDELLERIDEVDIIPGEEREMVRAFKSSSFSPPEESVVSMFRRQAWRAPEAIAVVCGDRALSYRDLDERSGRLAGYLRIRGVGAETLVPICMARGVEMILGMLGILKAGGAYVPIDPAYPAERIRYIMEDTVASLVITDNECSRLLPMLEGQEVLELDAEWGRSEEYGSSADAGVMGWSVGIRQDQSAYVIYTSGSTGRPKGVIVEHAGLINLICWHVKTYDVSFASRATSMAGIGFDAFGWEVWPYLSQGATLHIVNNDTRLSVARLLHLITTHNITHCFISTALLEEFLIESGARQLPLKYVLTGGDRLQAVNADNTTFTVFNNYGPTENTVVATFCKITKGDKTRFPPIGIPVNNCYIHILNEEKELLPIGVPGEIWIGGVQVARGYLNQVELTADRFVSTGYGSEPRRRLYRSGDIGRWLTDGNIEYLGRRDDQVKLRGYRIELGEIERVILESKLVDQAVVLVREDGSGNKQLVAYLVGGDKTLEEIKAFLNAHLPAYMVPVSWVRLTSMPLTVNGKLDRKGLADADVRQMADVYIGPRNSVERLLAEIWQELLGVERVGINNNFFELGGHSVLAIRLISAIRRELGKEVSIREVFDHATIGELAAVLEASASDLLAPPVSAVERPERIPLSFSQERLWFIDRLQGSEQYHLPAVLRLHGKVDIGLLEWSFREIVRRHEALRTVICEADGEPFQVVLEPDLWKLEVRELPSSAVEWSVKEVTHRRFDLGRDLPLRAELMVVGEELLLVVVLHHIASDGWSISIVVSELVALYNGGQQDPLPALPVQYADYAIWQRGWLRGEVLEKKLGYWKERLKGVEALALPTDHPRPAVQSNRGGMCFFEVEQGLIDELEQLCRQEGVTLFMLLLGAFKVLLYRYSGQEDICVGTAVANRGQKEIEGLIGFFVNTLALRNDLGGNPSFRGLLQQIRQSTLDAYEHQEVPFEKVVEAVVKERDLSRSPLFQVMLILENMPEMPALELGEAELEMMPVEQGTSQFDLSFSIKQHAAGLRVSVEYSTDLFDASTIGRMTGHYEQLLRSIAADAEGRIGELSMLSGEEERQLVEEFNATAVDYPLDRTVLDLFEEQAARRPEATAVVMEGQELSYGELDRRANGLGHHLRSIGVREDSLVGICMDRSVEMVIGILGIWKAGGAYVPIDPGYPAERIGYMLEDTAVGVVVSGGAAAEGLPERSGMMVIRMEQEEEWGPGSGVGRPERALGPEHLAYVIYTSGSTGRPKGVMVEHGNLLNISMGWRRHYGLEDEEPTVLSLASISFDVFAGDVCRSLLNKGRLILVPDDRRLDMEYLGEVIDRYGVSVLEYTPAFIVSIIREADRKGKGLRSLRMLIVGSDTISVADYMYLYGYCGARGIRLINSYGVTEATIDSSYFEGEVKGKANVPIGRPMDNIGYYILDEQQKLVPIGVKGDLYIGGKGVARGYWRRPELTEERFVTNPYFGSNAFGSHLYRTGDKGRWLSDGNMEYLGRGDEQVKIRGYRIEPGEIERVLEGCAGVRQAVVVAREDGSGSRRLIGYVVVDGTWDREAVLLQLRAVLPEYMVPSVLVELEGLPLTVNGKVDRKALPAPEFGVMSEGAYVGPRSETERVLAGIWEELLGVERVGINDNFFRIGGHSLMAIRLVAFIRQRFAITLPVIKIFQYGSIFELAEYIEFFSRNDSLPVETEFSVFEV